MNTFNIGNMDGLPNLAWSEGLEISLPQNLSAFLRKFNDSNSINELAIKNNIFSEELSLLAKEAKNDMLFRRAFTNTRPLSSRLPFPYHFIPSKIRTAIACILGEVQRKKVNTWAAFPKWPLDLSVDFIEDLIQKPAPLTPTPVLLTHDIDSPEGLENLYHLFLDLEEEVGARSANYVVPCAWPLNHSLLKKIQDRGHEIGVHGYDHSNKTPFLDSPERRKRLLAAQSFIARYDVAGYRAPSLVRTKNLLNDLSEFYAYDSSIPTSGGLFPVPNNGCATARPFRISGLLEIPLTLPRDGSLRFLGYTPQEILETWILCTEVISRSGGVVTLLTHCENKFSGNAKMLDVYRKFIRYIAEKKERYIFTLPRNI